MPELEVPEREEETPGDDEATVPEASPDTLDAEIDIRDDATATEAAAVAVAIGAHLADRQRAAAAVAAGAATEPERTDEWVLASRMRSSGKRRWPRDVERGNEWRAAARSL